MTQAADEFYNCVLDCHGHATARDCAMSEEAWWLRRASYRSRCRLIYECAVAFGIRVNHIRDIHAYNTQGKTSESSIQKTDEGVQIAIPTTDTITHNLIMNRENPGKQQSRDSLGDMVYLFDSCANIDNIRNGLLCSMHPSEGQ